MISTEQSRSRQGVVYGIAADGFWGLIPLYFKSVARVAPPEVLAHRAWWSFALLAICVYLLGRGNDLWQKLHDGKAVGMLASSALLTALNWLTFILAVFVFGEPFSSPQVLSFACIWTAILIYIFDSLRSAQQDRIEVVEPD